MISAAHIVPARSGQIFRRPWLHGPPVFAFLHGQVRYISSSPLHILCAYYKVVPHIYIYRSRKSRRALLELGTPPGGCRIRVLVNLSRFLIQRPALGALGRPDYVFLPCTALGSSHNELGPAYLIPAIHGREERELTPAPELSAVLTLK